MTTRGFFLNRLRLLGKDGLYSEIEFKKGLNVIVGPTNTGKSFIFECINFMLGGKDAPEQIEEVVNNEYDTILLELETYDGLKYTFEREFSGGNIKKYNCSINELQHETKFENLSQKHSVKKESMSKFLMSLSGYHNTNLYIKTNKTNKLKRFTYRNYNDFILIDEVKIISKESPVHSDNNKTKTAEEAAFRLILTGKDDSYLTENKRPNSSESTFTVQIGLIDKLINDLELNISLAPLELEENLEDTIKNLTSKRSGISSEIEKLSIARKILWREIQQYNSKILSTSELLKRFHLLKDQYETDMERISFLLEGEHYFSLLSYEKCPRCNQQIKNGELTCSHIEIEQKKESYKIELQKILLHLEDLKNTIGTMSEEVALLSKELHLKETEYNSLSKILDEQLEPQNYIVEEELRSVLMTQKIINEIEQKKNTLMKLQGEKNRLLGLLQSESDTNSSPLQSIDYNKYYDELCESIKYYLSGWKYPGYETIKFDDKHKDILISGKPRRLFGKGYRSISYSAFVLGVMRYCYLKSLPHPGLVVLDSPVTSYKEEDGDEDKTSEELQTRFFEFISEETSHKQVIIFENKTPPETVIRKINYVEFTKNKNKGRYGFVTIIK
ncbi:MULTISPECIES: hypothetical protein [Brevibacillus]|uniref:hypothetical protein n=1 Tax=Brevibacillus TaxID=55080 RepID=UPI001C8EE563|nr:MULTISPECIES: hypothetical protein [Brevibacillus]MBY0083917.1 hypothetical protein [Brevibacillus brevis]MCE0451399.1 hypothetical protein [Brevibacillus sp. AF8]